MVDAEDHGLWLRIAERFQMANLGAVVLILYPGQVTARKCAQVALSGLAARAAALSRRSGRPDPLDSITETTPAVLKELGVSEAQ